MGRRAWAAGLDWRASEVGEELSDAREAAGSAPAGAGTPLITAWTNRRLWGLSRAGTPGHAPGRPVAALQILAALPEDASLLAVWPIGDAARDEWWLLCAKDGLIAVDGDRLYRNEAEARAAALDHDQTLRFDTMIWNRLVLPSGWDGFSASPLTDASPWPLRLALRGRPVARLRSPVPNRARWLLPGGVALLAAAGLFGVVQYRDWSQRQAVLAARQALPRPVPMEAPPPPWTALPRAAEVLDRCWTALGRLSVPLGGWDISGLVCEVTPAGQASARATWTRSVGSIRDFQGQARGLLPADLTYAFSEDAESVTGIIPIEALPLAESAPGWTATDIHLSLHDAAQRGHMDLALVRHPRPRPGPDDDPAVFAALPPTYDAWTLRTWMAPPDWKDAMAAVPGLRLDSVAWEPARYQWVLSGLIYEKEPQ